MGQTTGAAQLAPGSPVPIRLDSLNARLEYLEGLLARYPNLLRANLQYRRNLLEVLSHVDAMARILGVQGEPLVLAPTSRLSLTFAEGATLSYDETRLSAVRKNLAEDLRALPIDHPISLESDIQKLARASTHNGVLNAGEYRAGVARLVRLAPILYTADGRGTKHFIPGVPRSAGPPASSAPWSTTSLRGSVPESGA